MVTVDKVYNDTYNGYTGQFFDWHSDRDIDLVIAKDANGVDSYAYDLTTVPGPNRATATFTLRSTPAGLTPT